MFFQSQAFLTEKSEILFGFFDFQNGVQKSVWLFYFQNDVQTRPQCQNLALKSQIGNPGVDAFRVD